MRVVAFCFGVGVEFCCVISGMNQIFDRVCEIATTLEVYGQLRGNLWRAFTVVFKQLFTCLLDEA